MKRLLCLILAMLTIPSLAQSSFTEYNWTFANMSFRYPSSWGEPIQRFETESGRVNMLLAQSEVESPENRAPEIPFITISLMREVTENTDIEDELENDLEAIGVNPIGGLPGTLLGRQSSAMQGTSRDGELFGMAQAIELEEDAGILIIYGRSPAIERDNFTAIFNAISNSIILSSSNSTLQPAYGVLWHQSNTLAEGADAFLDLGGIALAPDGWLYAVDDFQGLLQIDPQTGLIEGQFSLGDFLFATDIAIAPDNTIYVSDLDCNCIHVIVDGVEVNTIGGFAIDAPQSIAVTADNTLYATDIDDSGVIIRTFGTSRGELIFDVPPFEQPLLTADISGELVGLVDTAIVYRIVDGIFSEQYQLSSSVIPTAITVDSANNLVVATEVDAIMIFDSQGNEVNIVGEVSIDIPQAGEAFFPQGVATSPEGTIYWVDSDGLYGNITAMSLSVETGRVGSTNMLPGTVVQGFLEGDITRQLWTFDALSGDIITLTAIADVLSDLDLAIQLLDSTGREIAYSDNFEEALFMNPLDPQIDNLTLRQDGRYIVIVEALSGEGLYSLGLSRAETIDVSSGQVSITGAVSEALPVQRWLFDGRGGQTVEISMFSNSSTLDPILVLLSPGGNIIEENDDALDTALGFNAQITDIALASNGRYIIEARRFTGEGSYQLTIEIE